MLRVAGGWLLGAAVLFVAFVTLFPFAFRPPDVLPRFHVWPPIAGHLKDAVGNVVLFVPVGIAAGMLNRRARRRAATLVACGVTGFGLSLVVELLQTFLPARWPTLTDLLYNAAGAAAGGAVYLGLRPRIVAAAGRVARAPRLTTALAAGAAAALVFLQFALPAFFGNGGSLASWDEGCALHVGQEPESDRPWLGSVHELHLLSEALTPDEASALLRAPSLAASSVLASYDTTGPAPYDDRTGLLPPLRGIPTPRGDAQGPAVLSTDYHLSTVTSVIPAVARIRATSAFSLLATVSTRHPAQGRGRAIVSVCDPAQRRNVALVQSAHDLYVRVRTAMTGPTGWRPAFRVRGVFATRDPQRILATFDGSTLAVYVNGQERGRFRFTPETVILWRFSPAGWNLDTDAVVFPAAAFYRVLLFLPSTLLLAGLVRARGRPRRQAVVATAALVLTLAATTEALLTHANGAGLRPLHGATTAAMCVPALLLAARRRGPRLYN